ncbi:MAG TPA: heparan-alpha-glucosaminide N-acetyltransferase domain-containing protein [Pyrinomonadaceae bacterium]
MGMTVGESEAGVRVEKEEARVREGDGPSLLPAAARLRSLDVFRGMTVAGMILVNNPGSWGAIYSPLKHAEWHGWTPTDFVFPFFLFIVGVSITLALSRRAEAAGGRRDLYVKIVRRSAVIYGLGLFLTAFPFWDFGSNTFIDLSTLRLSGVLNRIAVCYLFAALIFLKTDWRKQSYVFAGLLVAYWAVLTFIPAPGFAAGDLSKEGSIASHLDRVVLAKHMWSGGKGVYEPEGILSTLGALATTFAGMLTGHLLRSRRTDTEKVSAMFVAGAACVVAGWAWNYWLPVNKPLWTSSYVLFTAGMALQLLAVCYWLIDIKGYRRWSVPFAVYGTNALAVFFLTGMCAELLGVIRLAGADGKAVSLHGLIFRNLFLSWASPVNASLAFAVCFVLFWLGVMWLLYRRNIFIKV